ncbi:MAG: hypothetical protein V4760_04680 [Bdellovibrionota bacterium]
MRYGRYVGRSIIGCYLVLLGVQYWANPFVPGPLARNSDRTPQSAHDMTISPEYRDLVHTDKRGLIVQADGDGGDTAQRTGMYYYVHHDPKKFAEALDRLEVAPGIYVRHPDQDGFRSDPRRFSRDQQRPLVIALGRYGMHDRLTRMANEHALRLGKYQNLDFISPVGVGEYIRAFDSKLGYPILLVSDIFLFLGSVQLVVTASFNPDDVDDNNHVMTLMQARDVMPTPFSLLAMKTYLWLRPENLGNSVFGIDDPVEGALAWYHRAETGGNPALGDAVYQALPKN